MQANELPSDLHAGTNVRVAVSDTATGMPPAVAARAFGPFFTTKEVDKGTSLGLNQVYGFIKQSGGEIVIEIAEGRRTTMAANPPVVEASVSEMNQEAALPTTEIEIVVLVEDELDLLGAAAEMFKNIGYEAVLASNTAEALDVPGKRLHFDILFSDIVLSHGPADLHLTPLVQERHPTIKIVLASGYPLSVLRQEPGDIRLFTFVLKPYLLVKLTKALRAPK